MTDRKPPGMSPEEWVRYQIRTAEARGSFRDLPLTGKPLPARALRLDRDWVAELVEREQLDGSALLPLSITLAREVEQLPGRLARERGEDRVRALVVDLDARIRAAYRMVLTGPPMRTLPLDVEAVVDRWRSSRLAELGTDPEQDPGADSDSGSDRGSTAVRARRSSRSMTRHRSRARQAGFAVVGVLVVALIVSLVALVAR